MYVDMERSLLFIFSVRLSKIDPSIVPARPAWERGRFHQSERQPCFYHPLFPHYTCNKLPNSRLLILNGLWFPIKQGFVSVCAIWCWVLHTAILPKCFPCSKGREGLCTHLYVYILTDSRCIATFDIPKKLFSLSQLIEEDTKGFISLLR
jgi:hypothetical protein